MLDIILYQNTNLCGIEQHNPNVAGVAVTQFPGLRCQRCRTYLHVRHNIISKHEPVRHWTAQSKRSRASAAVTQFPWPRCQRCRTYPCVERENGIHITVDLHTQWHMPSWYAKSRTLWSLDMNGDNSFIMILVVNVLNVQCHVLSAKFITRKH